MDHTSLAPDAAAPAHRTAPPVTEELRAHFAPLLRGTLLERCGIELRTLDPGAGTATMPVAGNTQPAGLLHGGATIALAESIASFCAILRAREVHGEGAQAVGTSVSALHHRSARGGTVTARCSARHLGRQVANYLVDVHDEDGALLSTVTVATQLLPPR
ncbi:PaaI family thioesterase [Brachybacterium saurashtrense]|uniref:PaaI family thioesterase n=1 Tax=Brachybacterium saurashtrense TaxID=556288 RepID=A0A345YM77_9MICO|nr:PaaI family thioesterase [Brachybacterium saurashtrense]AXK45029.1 PaaI family thioesterase [Brachybacterium saurashtrense]RRR21713.1 PaaI family thioesterase [Brachybacterium saurashtrense]